MSKFIPIFPLKIVAFPGEKVNLHIFEPRYKQMIKECFEEEKHFALPAFIDGKIMDVATEMRILSIEKTYPNGEMDIKTLGNAVCKLTKIYNPAPNKLYMAADAEYLHYNTRDDFQMIEGVARRVMRLLATLQIDKEIPLDDPNYCSFTFGHLVGFNLEQAYEFLCISDEMERLRHLTIHLKKIMPLVEQMEEMREKAILNGHFRHIDPPV